MKSITIHNLDKSLHNAIKAEAENNNTSLNQVIKDKLREVFGLQEENQSKSDGLDEFFGVWTKEEYQEFENAMKETERIDPEKW